MLYIFKTIYNFKLRWSINKHFTNTCTVYITYNSKLTTDNTGARGGVVVKALRYKPAGRGFDSRWCHLNFSVT